VIAAMPEEKASAASAPSSSASADASSSTVGFRRRPYEKPYSSSAITRPICAADSNENVVAVTIGVASGVPGASGRLPAWIARVEMPCFSSLTPPPSPVAPEAY
jgi:hypothetical protein